MADKRVTDLPVLSSPADADVLHAVDVSDSARDKQVTLQSVATLVRAGMAPTGHGHVAADVTDFTASSRVQVEATLAAGSNITLTPTGSGATRRLTIASTAAGGGGGTVTGVTGTAPIASSGGTSPAISIAPATTSGAGSMSSTDKSKLDGVASGATANATDSALRDRSTHTGTQLAATVSDFPASARVQVEGTLVAGANVTLTPSGSGASRTIAIASTAAGGGGGTVTNVSGTAPIQVASGTTTPAITITAATTSAAGSMSGADKAKLDGIAPGATANAGTVTGVAGIAPIFSSGGASPSISITPAAPGSAGYMSGGDKTKIDGIAPGATANATDNQLRDRGTHTGVQTASTISDFAASSRAQVDATLTAGANITLTPTGSGATRSIAISAAAAGGGGATDLDGLSDVSIISPANGQILGRSGGFFRNLIPMDALVLGTNHVGTAGAARLGNCISLSQAAYDAIATKVATTLYVIVG